MCLMTVQEFDRLRFKRAGRAATEVSTEVAETSCTTVAPPHARAASGSPTTRSSSRGVRDTTGGGTHLSFARHRRRKSGVRIGCLLSDRGPEMLSFVRSTRR